MIQLLPRMAFVLALLAPAKARAVELLSGPQAVLDSVGRLLPNALSNSDSSPCSGGADSFLCIVGGAIGNLRPAIIVVSALVITIAGFRMIIVQDEEVLTKARNTISACLTGIVMAFLIEPFIDAFYGGIRQGVAASVPRGGMQRGAGIVFTEVMGVINFVLVIVATLAIFMIVVSGLKAIASAGNEEGLTKLRKSIFAIGAGILLILFKEIIARTFGLEGALAPVAPSVSPITQAAIDITTYVFGFLALVTFAVIVFAGFRMVFNFGNEEQFTKARQLIVRAIIGLLVIVVSLAIVRFVIQAAVGIEQL